MCGIIYIIINKSKTMTLKKKYLTIFYKTLAEGKSDVARNHISLADARVRDGLATKIIYGLLNEFEMARKKIYEEFAIKKEDGTVDMKGTEYQFKPEVLEELTNEIKLLEDEEVTFEVADPDKIKLFINNTKYEPAVGETILIDELLALIVK